MKTLVQKYSLLLFGTIFLLVALSLTSCNEDAVPDIDPVFQPFVDSFFQEWQDRGGTLSQEDFDFTVKFGLPDGSLAGLCRTFTKEIEINEFHWANGSEETREHVMFHELGHCLLDRRHDNQLMDNGECKSIMKGTEENTCRRNFESELWREYYIDELFDDQITAPDWYASEVITEISLEGFQDTTANVANGYFIYLPDFDSNQNFEFIASFDGWERNNSVSASWGDLVFTAGNPRSVLISDINGDARYFNSEILNGGTTELRFVHQDGFDYFLVDGNMFHIDQIQNDFNSISLKTEFETQSENVDISIKLNLLQ